MMPDMSNYNLNIKSEDRSAEKTGAWITLKRLMTLVGQERRNLYIAMIFILINSGLILTAPYLIGQTVDRFIVTHQYEGVIRNSILLLIALAESFQCI